MEVFGATAGLFEDAVDRSRVDAADIRRGLDRAAVSEALDDADDRLFWELGVPQERPLSLSEPMLARLAVQSADLLVLAGPLDDRKVAGVELVKIGAV